MRRKIGAMSRSRAIDNDAAWAGRVGLCHPAFARQPEVGQLKNAVDPGESVNRDGVSRHFIMTIEESPRSCRRTAAMENARSSPVLGDQLSMLYNLGAAGSLTDGQLLDRFLARNDPAVSEAAFNALIDRHGPMVLGICRQLLGDSHDAHDAFQATFLVLVSKAGSIRRREAIGGWLFGIAQGGRAGRMARPRRRRRHLQGLAESRSVSHADVENGAANSAGADYSPLINEIDRLPEQLRSPVVLHYFEGLSTEATAQRLGCPRGTVLSRLSRARGRIKDRLEKQGVSFSAIIPASEVLNRWLPPMPVPAGLSQATVRAAGALGLAGAAIESVVPAAVATLSTGVARTLVFSKVRAAAALFLLAVAGVSIGLAATSRPGDEPRKTGNQPDMAGPASSPSARSKISRSEEKPMGESYEYTGLVLNPDGKPIEGAKLHLAYWSDRGQVRSRVLGTTDARGRFRFTVTNRDFTDHDGELPWASSQVVATAEGFGIGWSDPTGAPGKKADPHELTILLAKDDVTIEGRIVNLEGHPVAGAVVLPRRILEPEHGDLSGWLTEAKDGQAGAIETDQKYLIRTIGAEGRGALRVVHDGCRRSLLDPGHRQGAHGRAEGHGADGPDQGDSRTDPLGRAFPRECGSSQPRLGHLALLRRHASPTPRRRPSR